MGYIYRQRQRVGIYLSSEAACRACGLWWVCNELGTIMNVIQRIQSIGGEYSSTIGDMLQMEEHDRDSFVNALSDKFADSPQLQYILAVLWARVTSLLMMCLVLKRFFELRG